MNSLKRIRPTTWLWPLCVLSLLTGCASQPCVPTYIAVKPKVTPLSAELSQAMQPNSTDLLKRAEDWYESSGKLLDSVTAN